MGDKISQLVLEKTKTLQVLEVDNIKETGGVNKGHSNTGMNSNQQSDKQSINQEFKNI